MKNQAVVMFSALAFDLIDGTACLPDHCAINGN